jgi:cytidylate kinase
MSPRSVDAIVESQVQRWIGERARNPAGPAEPAPVIAVSREYGARGAAVARIVADRLGFTFWNRELLAAIAQHAHLDPSSLAQFDEHHRSALLGTVSGMIPRASSVSQVDYARELTLVVRDLVRRGGAVLVGRGIGFMIDAARVLRVRVVCPLEVRIRGVAERERIELEAARTTVEYADRDRRAFVRDLYGKEIDDFAGYDVWVSTEHLTLDAAAAVIVAAYRARFGEHPARTSVSG